MGYAKKIGLWVVLALLHAGCRGQGTAKTMLAQLTALKGYAVTIEKGYRIAEDGLHLVQDIKSGEFGLHKVFFRSLKTVGEGVLQSPALEEASRLIEAIDRAFAQAIPACVSSGGISTNELQYIQELQQNLSGRCRDDRQALQVLTTDEALSMTDGERISRINDIRTALRIRYSEVKNFLAGTAWLIVQRKKEGAYIGTLKKWHDIQ
ncbi:MAG: hypothetical protein J0H74_28770 [Chitinophagaceae bacterium]|nr:hypothetical protein [Chitinophagaceae bacterium]